LFAAFIQRIEGVEKFLLGAFLAGDELDIIHGQQVGLAVFFLELGGGAVADGQNQLIGEFLALDIQELIIRVILAYLAADGIDEVGFAQAAAAVHKERVVAFGGVIGYRPGRGVGQAVAAAHHEGLEGILLFGLEIQPVILLRRGGCGGSLTRGDLHLHREAHDLLKAGGEQGIVFFVDDIPLELCGALQAGGAAIQGGQLQLPDPEIIGDLAHFAAAQLLYPFEYIDIEPHFICIPGFPQGINTYFI